MITELHFETESKGDNSTGMQLIKVIIFLQVISQSHLLLVGRVKHPYKIEGDNSIELTQSRDRLIIDPKLTYLRS